MQLKQAVKIRLAEQGKTQGELAQALQLTPGNMSRLLSKDDFRVIHDLALIANALDCDIQVCFVRRDNGEALPVDIGQDKGE